MPGWLVGWLACMHACKGSEPYALIVFGGRNRCLDERGNEKKAPESL